MAGRKPSVSDVEILREMAISPDPVLTAVELADQIDMSQQGAHSRLESLEDQEYVRSKKAGSRARVWWITDRGRQQLSKLD